MKKGFLLFTILVITLFMSSCSESDSDTNLTSKENTPSDNMEFAIISDIHYFSPSLYDNQKNPAFNKYLESDRKMIKESSAILTSAIDRIIEKHPDFLLIPGDLTKDGEKQSHEDLALKFRKIEEKGIKVFVIPGNHDINNPHAESYLAGGNTKISSISKNEFSQIYNDFGYSEALYKDAASLSYVVEPTNDVWLLCLDVCKYDQNDENTCVTGGAMRPETQIWVKTILDKAKTENKRVFSMMHHGMVEHIFGESQILSEYLIDNYITIGDELAELGMNIVFTGHMHANDISKRNSGDNYLIDIETGSTVTYPCPIRFLEYDSKKDILNINTSNIESIKYPGAEYNFQNYAQESLCSGMSSMIINILGNEQLIRSLIKDDGEISTFVIAMIKDKIASGELLNIITMSRLDIVLGKLLIQHYGGDEEYSSSDKKEVDELNTKLLPLLKNYLPAGMTINTAFALLYNDINPSDNNLSIDCKTGNCISITK